MMIAGTVVSVDDHGRDDMGTHLGRDAGSSDVLKCGGLVWPSRKGRRC